MFRSLPSSNIQQSFGVDTKAFGDAHLSAVQYTVTTKEYIDLINGMLLAVLFFLSAIFVNDGTLSTGEAVGHPIEAAGRSPPPLPCSPASALLCRLCLLACGACLCASMRASLCAHPWVICGGAFGQRAGGVGMGLLHSLDDARRWRAGWHHPSFHLGHKRRHRVQPHNDTDEISFRRCGRGTRLLEGAWLVSAAARSVPDPSC